MATHHAEPGEIVNLATWSEDLPEEHSKVIARTDEMELARLILPSGEEVGHHEVKGPLIIHCISGCVEVTALGQSKVMGGGELLYLPPEKFVMKATRRAMVLVTFIFS